MRIWTPRVKPEECKFSYLLRTRCLTNLFLAYLEADKLLCALKCTCTLISMKLANGAIHNTLFSIRYISAAIFLTQVHVNMGILTPHTSKGVVATHTLSWFNVKLYLARRSTHTDLFPRTQESVVLHHLTRLPPRYPCHHYRRCPHCRHDSAH